MGFREMLPSGEAEATSSGAPSLAYRVRALVTACGQRGEKVEEGSTGSESQGS